MQRFTSQYGEGLFPDSTPRRRFDGLIRMWYASSSEFQPLNTIAARLRELMKIPTPRTDETGKFWLTAGTAIPLAVLLLLLGVFIVLVRNW